MADKAHLDSLKAAATPARVADALGLRRQGNRFFCPVCQPDGGKTPDLAIKDKGFNCFKCGLKGDALELVMKVTGKTFPEAVAWMEDLTGIRSKNPPGARPARGPGQGSKKAPGVGPRAPEGPSRPTCGDRERRVADPAVYEAFLDACRPVEGPVLEWLERVKGVSPATVEACRLRFCGREYRDVMDSLKGRFGDDELVAAGLLKRNAKGDLVASFWHYYAKKAGFLVIPYILDGRPVYLKVRPPCSKADAERRELVRFMNTAAGVPCLYNADALTAKPEKILVCEGESDTWAALSHGWPAVGSPGSKAFKPSWVEGFRSFVDASGRSTVYLVPDADAAGKAAENAIADLFLKAGLPVPQKLTLPSGKDLSEYLLSMTE